MKTIMAPVLALLLVAALLATPLAASAGQSAPDFRASRLEGGTLSLVQLKGKVVVLNFFRTFCPYCVGEVPELNELNERLGPKGLAVIGVGIDSLDSLKRYVASHGVRYPVVVCSDEMLRSYGDIPGTGGLRGVPTTVIIGPGGQVSRVFLGRADKADLERQVKALLPTT